MNREPDCIFCKIVSGEIPSIKIYENDHTLAFMDINPVSAGHVLVIPKGHWSDLYAMPDHQLGHVDAIVRKVATAVRDALKPDGVSVMQANGKGAAQSVMHYHVHIVPRTLGDELKINWQLVPGDLEQIAGVAEKIKAHMPEA